MRPTGVVGYSTTVQARNNECRPARPPTGLPATLTVGGRPRPLRHLADDTTGVDLVYSSDGAVRPDRPDEPQPAMPLDQTVRRTAIIAAWARRGQLVTAGTPMVARSNGRAAMPA